MATIELKTTNGELVDLMNGLFATQDIKGKDFAFIVSKNINKLQDHLKNVEKLGQPSEEFVKFAAEIRAAQDANDTEAVKEMETRNASLIAERKNQIEDVQKLLKESAKPIKLNSLPKDLIPNEVTARQINNLEKIII
jgi:hypothetical protein|tara:strand:+ start:10499 stop:10912 length:414 start_codon:yes stop_codon:yes gene_type:complete